MQRIVLRFLVLISAAAAIVACDSGTPTGSAALRITFADPPADHGLRHRMSGIVDRIRVMVSSDGVQLVENAYFDYENEQGEHEPGTVYDIPAGQDRNFLVEALSPDDVVVFDCLATGVTILANQTVDVPVTLAQAFDDPEGDRYPPAPVTDLVAVADGVDVVLEWSATGDDWMIDPADRYDIRYSENSIDADNFISANWIDGAPAPGNPGDQDTFTVTVLPPGRTYHFAMKVIDNAGNPSELSNDVFATTEGDETAPAAIGDLDAPEADVTETSVTLTWTAPADDGDIVASGSVDSYDVRWADVPIVDDLSWEAATPFPWPPATTIVAPGVDQTLEVTDLTPDQEYHFAVKACDEVLNCSGISNYATGTPHDYLPPAAVELIVYEVTDDSVTLTWTAPGDDDNEAGTAAASYDIRYSENPIDAGNFDDANPWEFPFDPQLAGSTESVTIAPLDFFTTYYFAMISYDEVPNPSDLSNVVDATPGTQDVTPPAAVDDLEVTTEIETLVVLRWIAPGDDGTAGDPVVAYDVRYAGVPIEDEDTWLTAAQIGGPSGADIVAAGEVQTFDVDVVLYDLLVGTTYHFALKSEDNSGNVSGLSNPASGGPRDVTPPSDITDLEITASGDDFVDLQWTAPGDSGDVGQATEYQIYYHDAAFDDPLDAALSLWGSAPLPGVQGSLETETISGLTPGSQVFVRIRTRDEVDNWSGLSNQVDQVLSCAACPVIDQIRPAAAPAGALIWLEGSNFEAAQGTVRIGGMIATVLSWSENRIVVRVPAASGAVDLIVTNSIGMSSSPFHVPPYIDALSPDTVTPPDTVSIIGTGFGGRVESSSVQFTGAAAVFADDLVSVSGWTDNQIVLVVPADALTGPVFVTVDGHASNTPLLTASGARSWTGPFIRVDDAFPATFPQLASDSSGDLQLVWLESDGTYQQVLGEARQGGAWQGVVTDISLSAVDSASPRLTSAGAGDFRAIWLDGVAAVRSGSGFADAWSAAESVAPEPAGNAVIGHLPDDRLVVAWTAGSGLSVRFNIHDPVGGWGTPQELAATTGNTNFIGGAVDPAGNFHVAFIDGTFLIHYYYDSTDWVGPAIVEAPTDTPAGVTVDLASDPKGYVHAMWWDAGRYWYSPWDGDVWTEQPQQVSAIIGTIGSGWLELVADGAGTLHAVVEDDGSGSDYDIIYFELEPGGWTMGLNLSYNNPDNARAPSLAVTPDLVVDVVWSEVDRIYFRSWE